MSTSQLSTFCTAVYVKQQPLSSQPKFLKALFESAGANFAYGDDYGRKLFNGTKDLTQDVCDTFPATIDAAKVEEFLRKYLTDTTGKKSDLTSRCTKIAADAGLPKTLTINPDTFIPALGDWFRAIIKNPVDCDILTTAYQRRLEGETKPDLGTFTPLYAGDEVIVSQLPSQQSYTAPFWGGFSHEWTFQNKGTLAWSGRLLRCGNPTDNGVRPGADVISVPDTAPQGFAKVTCEFEVHGHEGKATSQWRMIDAQGNECFPNHSTSFNVVVDVVNPDAPRSEVN